MGPKLAYLRAAGVLQRLPLLRGGRDQLVDRGNIQQRDLGGFKRRGAQQPHQQPALHLCVSRVYMCFHMLLLLLSWSALVLCQQAV